MLHSEGYIWQCIRLEWQQLRSTWEEWKILLKTETNKHKQTNKQKAQEEVMFLWCKSNNNLGINYFQKQLIISWNKTKRIFLIVGLCKVIKVCILLPTCFINIKQAANMKEDCIVIITWLLRRKDILIFFQDTEFLGILPRMAGFS